MKAEPQFTYLFQKEEAESLARSRDYFAKFRRMSKAKQRALLIKWGALTPEGNLPVYPMDHVPLGPRE